MYFCLKKQLIRIENSLTEVVIMQHTKSFLSLEKYVARDAQDFTTADQCSNSFSKTLQTVMHATTD